MASRGILSYGVHLPYRRLDRSEIRPVAGTGGGTGTRTVASYDEDTTTMGVEAARVALRSAPDTSSPSSLWFSTVAPAYADKTNATAIHAALRLDAAVPAFDANGSVRSAVGALRAGLSATGPGPSLVVTADMRTGLPGSPDEASGGDAGAALLVGEGGAERGLLAELIGEASVTEEFLDRWRAPGDTRSKLWEERFGEGRYLAVGQRAWEDALKSAGLVADQVDRVLIAGSHARAVGSLARKLGVGEKVHPVGDRLAAGVGFTGAAHPALLLAAALDDAEPNQTLALVVLADGADVLILRATDAIAGRSGESARSVADQIAIGGPVPYGTALAWRGFLPVEPPRRPEPARPSASAAGRSTDWKFGFVGSESSQGAVHLPPAPTDDRDRPMAEATGTIVTFTVDRMAYSPSPPVVFAVVDFDGGGRLPVELTDVDADEVRIGARVEMTFRKLFTADGIHNYFWKARPVRAGTGEGS
jgi:hydroxymethylglutaryl-CoA synthase